MRTLLLGLAVSLGAAGCLAPVRPSDRTVRLDASRVAAVRDSLGAASGPTRLAVTARQLAAAGLTPLADGSFRAGLDGALVGGLVPGREPVARPSLVVVGVGAGDPEAATVVEVARLLVGRSKREVVPEQSVLFVLWDSGMTPRQALAGVARSSVWPRDLVTAVLVVGDVAGTAGAPVTSLAPDGPASVERLVAQVAEAARRPVPEADSATVR